MELKAYRDRYAKIQTAGAQVVAISTDDVETLAKFKASLGAPFLFLSDPGGTVAKQYGGLDEGYANRVTYVIQPDGTIVHTDRDMDAIVPDPAIDACKRPGAPTTL
jgi:peroxiredoxin